MKLHENNEEFRVVISNAAKNSSMPEHVVEKDYWVTKLLLNLSNYKHREYVVFKGGTSLSKGHKLINRFSEDIDLALHQDGIGEGKIHRRGGDALHQVIAGVKDSNFTDIANERESEKKRYKRAYNFPQIFTYPEGSPIHGKIILEINSFSDPTPTEEVEIISLAGEHLLNENSAEAVNELGLGAFKIQALKPERAFCEKLLALRRASHKGGEFFAARVRHIYDIHQLYNAKRLKEFISNVRRLEEMLQKCHADDEPNQKITQELGGKLSAFEIFKDPNKKIVTVKTSYEALKDITFDKTIPTIEEVSQTLSEINEILENFSFFMKQR